MTPRSIPRIIPRRIALLMLALLAPLLCAGGGCATDPTAGYASSSTFPTQINSVAVVIFDNRTYEREIEFHLHEALIKELSARTPYRVTQPGRADSILTGRVVTIERDQLSRSRSTGLSEEVLLKVTIDFEWKDVRTGRVLVERRAFTADSVFMPSPPLGESIELGRFAVVQKLARDIVNELRADW